MNTLLPWVTGNVFRFEHKLQDFEVKGSLGTLSKKKNDIIWEFFPTWGGGLPKSQNFFCKFTKYFFVCQIHSEVLKHVLQMGG